MTQCKGGGGGGLTRPASPAFIVSEGLLHTKITEVTKKIAETMTERLFLIYLV